MESWRQKGLAWRRYEAKRGVDVRGFCDEGSSRGEERKGVKRDTSLLVQSRMFLLGEERSFERNRKQRREDCHCHEGVRIVQHPILVRPVLSFNTAKSKKM
jgi:hypothetical protein